MPDHDDQRSRLPAWNSVVAVVAHPDDESFGLGAILDGFHHAGAATTVLCLTRGEASTLHGVDADLSVTRGLEFAAAAQGLGVAHAMIRSFPDGALSQVCRSALAGEVIDAARAVGADGLLVFDVDGVTGHPDHMAATEAATLAAAGLGLPVLAWTLPAPVASQLNREFGTSFIGHDPTDIDIELPVCRVRQTTACAAHVSQAIPTSVLWRRLELLGGTEHLRWLSGQDSGESATAPQRPSRQKEVHHDTDVRR